MPNSYWVFSGSEVSSGNSILASHFNGVMSGVEAGFDAVEAVVSGSWNNVAFQNGWANYGAFLPMQYKKIGDFVHLRGLIDPGTLTNGTVLFNLPVGYRPQYTHTFPVLSAIREVFRVDVDAIGDVKLFGAESYTPVWISLAGLAISLD